MRSSRERRLAAVCLLILVAASGCHSLAPLPEPVPEPTLEPAPERVLLILADELPSLRAVFDALTERLAGREVETLSLAGADALPTPVRRRLERGHYRAAVAIGRGAGAALTGVAVEQRIFCQVFDHRDLVADGMAGVAVLPSAAQTLVGWKQRSPDLATIGMLTGPGLESLAEELAEAAAAVELDLVHRQVETDQAFFQAFRGLSRSIDGLLLIPDHRVLSPRVIRATFAYASKRSVEILAFTPSLLELGAVAVSRNDPADVAGRVIGLLDDPTLYRATRGKVLPLTLARLQTREALDSPARTAVGGRHAPLD